MSTLPALSLFETHSSTYLLLGWLSIHAATWVWPPQETSRSYLVFCPPMSVSHRPLLTFFFSPLLPLFSSSLFCPGPSLSVAAGETGLLYFLGTAGGALIRVDVSPGVKGQSQLAINASISRRVSTHDAYGACLSTGHHNRDRMAKMYELRETERHRVRDMKHMVCLDRGVWMRSITGRKPHDMLNIGCSLVCLCLSCLHEVYARTLDTPAIVFQPLNHRVPKRIPFFVSALPIYHIQFHQVISTEESINDADPLSLGHTHLQRLGVKASTEAAIEQWRYTEEPTAIQAIKVVR